MHYGPVNHMYEFHPLEERDPQIKCNYCDDSFTSKKELMFHKKKDHPENVPFCNNISNDTLNGVCETTK